MPTACETIEIKNDRGSHRGGPVVLFKALKAIANRSIAS